MTEQVWGAPQTEPAHWSLNKTLAAVGIAAVLAGAGAAVIYAAGGSTEQSGRGFGGPPGGMDGPPGGPGGMGPGGMQMTTDSLHGEFVIADGRGGYATELTQTGTVTEVSDASITARSEDGFTQTYVITDDTRQGREPLQQGDTASIRAVAGEGTNTATVISAAD
ncbi:hypothetical protein BH10ACT9_BH10ACT9_28840 [soil metagenome]